MECCQSPLAAPRDTDCRRDMHGCSALHVDDGSGGGESGGGGCTNADCVRKLLRNIDTVSHGNKPKGTDGHDKGDTPRHGGVLGGQSRRGAVLSREGCHGVEEGPALFISVEADSYVHTYVILGAVVADRGHGGGSTVFVVYVRVHAVVTYLGGLMVLRASIVLRMNVRNGLPAFLYNYLIPVASSPLASSPLGLGWPVPHSGMYPRSLDHSGIPQCRKVLVPYLVRIHRGPCSVQRPAEYTFIPYQKQQVPLPPFLPSSNPHSTHTLSHASHAHTRTTYDATTHVHAFIITSPSPPTTPRSTVQLSERERPSRDSARERPPSRLLTTLFPTKLPHLSVSSAFLPRRLPGSACRLLKAAAGSGDVAVPVPPWTVAL